jgi:hypothetical protein
MRTLTAVPILATAVLLVAAMTAGAQVPTTMNYQVMLTDDAGQALVDTAVQIVFRLYTDPLGGSLKWIETHNTSTNHIGVVSVILGETTPLDPTDFTQPLWLAIQVGGETLTPRREITSAAFALRAHDSDYLGGLQASDYALDTEILDAPGVAGVTSANEFWLTGGIDILESQTITAPRPGYVLAIATARAYFYGVGVSDWVSFGVSTNFNAFPSGGAVDVRVPDDGGDGWYQVVTVHGLFEVTGGADAFWFLGERHGGNCSANDLKLTLIYFPTTYGTVDKTEPSDLGSGEIDISEAVGPLTEPGAALKHSESDAGYQARFDAELAAMRAEMNELRTATDELRVQLDAADGSSD